MNKVLDHAVQRTWDLQISCTCSQPIHCERFHGLPLLTADFINALPGYKEHNAQRDRLHRAYEEAPNPEARKEAFMALTAPFNEYY